MYWNWNCSCEKVFRIGGLLILFGLQLSKLHDNLSVGGESFSGGQRLLCVPSVLWRCWLGDKKGLWSVRNGLLGSDVKDARQCLASWQYFLLSFLLVAAEIWVMFYLFLSFWMASIHYCVSSVSWMHFSCIFHYVVWLLIQTAFGFLFNRPIFPVITPG